MPGRYRNKRILSVLEVMQSMGENPTRRLINLANLAEKAGNLETASKNWRELLSYIEAKRKPIDPVEQKKLEKQILTMEELSRLKAAVLAGACEIIEENSVIEGELVPVKSDSLSEFI